MPGRIGRRQEGRPVRQKDQNDLIAEYKLHGFRVERDAVEQALAEMEV
jgi:hypothetical protein